MAWGLRNRPQLVWHTELSAEECLRRLRESVDTSEAPAQWVPGSSNIVGHIKPVIGTLDGEQIRLERKQTERNFSINLYGRMEPDSLEGGTRIAAHIGMSPRTRLGLPLIGYGLLGLALGTAFRPFSPSLGISIFLLAALLYSTGVIIIRRRWRSCDEPYLIGFLEETLEAKQVTPS